MLGRRSFLASLAGLTGALVLPEPARVRAYSFLPGERAKTFLAPGEYKCRVRGLDFTAHVPLEVGMWVSLDVDGYVVPVRMALPFAGPVEIT